MANGFRVDATFLIDGPHARYNGGTRRRGLSLVMSTTGSIRWERRVSTPPEKPREGGPAGAAPDQAERVTLTMRSGAERRFDGMPGLLPPQERQRRRPAPQFCPERFFRPHPGSAENSLEDAGLQRPASEDVREWLETDGRGGFASGTVALPPHPPVPRDSPDRPKPPRDATCSSTESMRGSRLPGGRYRSLAVLQRRRDSPRRRTATWRNSRGTRGPDGGRCGWNRDRQEVFVSRESGATARAWAVGAGKGSLGLRLSAGRDHACTAAGRTRVSFRVRDPMNAKFSALRRLPETAIHPTGITYPPFSGSGSFSTRRRGAGARLHRRSRLRGYRLTLSRGGGPSSEAVQPRMRTSRGEMGDPSRTLRRGLPRCAGRRSSPGAIPVPARARADDYVVQRGTGEKTVVAGYPWFRPGAAIRSFRCAVSVSSTGRLAEAGEILLEWAGGLFGHGSQPLSRSARKPSTTRWRSLWYVLAVHDTSRSAGCAGAGWARPTAGPGPRRRRGPGGLFHRDAIRHRGRFGRAPRGGHPGVQLTWMARRSGRVITPHRQNRRDPGLGSRPSRSRKPLCERWVPLARAAIDAFSRRFWNEDAAVSMTSCDCDHVAGRRTRASGRTRSCGRRSPFRGSVGEKARRVVDAVEEKPGPARPSIAAGGCAYAGRYAGDVESRDAAYHQGTVWPWLAGPFIEAWVRVRGGDEDVRRQARTRFFEPLRASVDAAGLGHLPEVADGDSPHAPGGCPFQAWSVGEAIRLDLDVLADGNRRPSRTSRRHLGCGLAER